jgi:hypothetical protein
MKKTLLGLVLLFLAVGMTVAQTTDKWLHVKVDNTGDKTERVRVNIPLDLAEKILPAIHKDHLQAGKLRLGEAKINDIDLRAMMDAIRSAKDNEFVTVDSQHANVRVAKQGGNLVVKVNETKQGRKEQKVDISIPFSVIDALFSSGNKGELDLVAAVRALAAHGDTVLVTVTDGSSNVRIWVDSVAPAAQ